MQRVLVLVIFAAASLAAACGPVPAPEIGIATVENLVCSPGQSGEQRCTADVQMQLFLPEGVADQLTVVVSSPGTGNASLTGNTSGTLASTTWIEAQGSAPSCVPGMATVYVSSMLQGPTGEVVVDGKQLEREITCE